MDNEVLNLYRAGKVSLNEVLESMSSNNKYYDKNESKVKTMEKSKIDIEKEKLKSITLEFDSLIGLTNVKSLVKEIQAFIEIQRKRENEQLIAEPVVLHMIFRGNPGTGKTTVARIIGKMFKEMGLLKNGHLVEIERANLVGEYIGHTAGKVKKEIKRALGGILFIDEAYSLARGGEKDFGKEAIDALVKAMEDHKDELILILAGYGDEMDLFLDSNPGLRSRFPINLDFKDYSISELIEIAKKISCEKEYKLTDEAINKLKRVLAQKPDSRTNGNARLVRNIIERSFRKQAVRLQNKKNLNREDLMLIIDDDIQGDDVY
ncbi:stage V sporulation protein K [Gottschalkia acidurici 9a]|uniref:Stage V sporulation protein K n=1 Tax=Gottschalkia acidurici (strain ATCC 7906 / DSM 604 / BCRC 14475 / CIP 104303 / KCTC 5404 / NCIMB 10678 / 9a) TaxID=1128398 RepID=K0B0T7_GOTA9|nr:AAA family ATPase [Gottschalkia acidurici]AFS78530.1 stage V sporulation protein K [Gottschalkia acidurici 9a]